jgi:hypothetical protein
MHYFGMQDKNNNVKDVSCAFILGQLAQMQTRTDTGYSHHTVSEI